jgi:glycosyltransferase involved in cell wall biosynthesis
VVVPLREHLPGAVPSKLYEAMASGKPVVLVAAGEPAAMVRQHEAGIVVPPGDVPALAAALQRLAADPHLRDRLGCNARRAAELHYDRAGIATRFISLLEAAK